MEQQGTPGLWGLGKPGLQLYPASDLGMWAAGHSVGIWPSSLVFLTPVPACPQLLEVNKQWDQHFRTMKQQYEQKVMELLGTELRLARGGGMRSL